MSFAPSQIASNSAIQWSRGERAGGPVLLDFSSGWGKGIVFDWYKRMRSTAVAKIQLRKEFEEPFRHEFILVYLQRGGYCRLDRRGDPNVPTQTLRSEGSEAYDTIHEVSELGEIDSTSECLVELRPNGAIDLSFILSICFSIRSDPKTQRYTLQRFNCYFFSWTITSVVARHSVAWEPAQLSDSGQLTSILKERATEPIAKKVTKLSMDCVSAVFICTLGPRVRKVLRKHFRPTGFLPTSVLNAILSLWMKRYMQPRMEAVMRDVVHSAMTTTMASTVDSLLDSRSSVMRTALSHTLWLDSVRETLQKTARVALRDAIWALMVKTLKSANDADIPVQQHYEPATIPVSTSPSKPSSTCEPSPLSNLTIPPRKWKVGGLLDKILVPGATAITDNSYDTAICSAWGMSDGLVGDAQTREEWVAGWDQLWRTVLQHARNEGQAVVRDVMLTEPPDAARDEIWEVIWEELEVGFERSRPIVRDYMWESFEYATSTVVDVISDAVFAALQENPQHPVQAALNRTGAARGKGTPRWAEVNHTELQGWIKRRIQKHGDKISRLGLGLTNNVQTDIREAMGRVWEHVSKHGGSSLDEAQQ